MLLRGKSRVNNHLKFSFDYDVCSHLRSILPHTIFCIVCAVVVCRKVVCMLHAQFPVVKIPLYTLFLVLRSLIFQCVERETVQFAASMASVNCFILRRFKHLRLGIEI